MLKSKKYAFTLAEVLVTLGIIGVVSAITIPSLTQSWQKQAYVAQLKKAYSQLSQAALQSMNEESAVSMGETKYSYQNRNAESNFLKDNFKVVQDCGANYRPCFAQKYKYMDGSEFRDLNYNPDAAVTTADGMAIAIWWNSFGDYDEDWHNYMQLFVDVNGQKGPNVVGRDLFYVELYDDGKVAESYTNDKSDACTDFWGYGIGCLSRIMNNGWVMDY